MVMVSYLMTPKLGTLARLEWCWVNSHHYCRRLVKEQSQDTWVVVKSMASYSSADAPMEICWLDEPTDVPKRSDFRPLWPGSMACYFFLVCLHGLNDPP